MGAGGHAWTEALLERLGEHWILQEEDLDSLESPALLEARTAEETLERCILLRGMNFS